MRERLIWLLDSIAKNSWINLLFGLVLFASGINEAVSEYPAEFRLRSHHGVVLIGLAQSFRSLSMILRALK